MSRELRWAARGAGDTTDGTAVLLRELGDARRKLKLARKELSRQRVRAEKYRRLYLDTITQAMREKRRAA